MKLHAKCNLTLNQQAVGSLSPTLRRKQEEYLAATDDLERGEKFVKILPIFWVWSDDLEQAKDSCTRVRRLWENNGYVMQQDNMILKILFLSSSFWPLHNRKKHRKPGTGFCCPSPISYPASTCPR